jgi:hypothetical protein
MFFIASVLNAQSNKLESIYNQMPPLPEKCMCQNIEFYEEEMSVFESLTNQLEEIRIQLNEEIKNKGDETYNTISAGFPTEEEFSALEKLSEEEQIAFWEKMEDEQASIHEAIASNSIKYQAEKEALNQKLRDYQDDLLLITEEYVQLDYKAGKVKSDKSRKIYNTCIENDSLSNYGKQQIDEICIEFCSVVSMCLLKKLRFEYSNIKQNMALYRRLMVIELAEFSALSEEVVSVQNAAALDLNDLEILAQYISNYKTLYNILPGGMDNQK